MTPPVPIPSPTFITRDGFVMTREEFTAHLIAHRKALRDACECGLLWIKAVFPQEYNGPQADIFAEAVYQALTVGLDERIAFLQSPVPETATTIGYPPGYTPPTVEDLATQEMKLEALREQLQQIEDAADDCKHPDAQTRLLVISSRQIIELQIRDTELRCEYIRREVERAAPARNFAKMEERNPE